MDALLYRWSTGAQLVSVLMIALFYATLARSLKRPDVVWWARAWWCNFAAMALTLVYWVATLSPGSALLMRSLYVGGKAGYALLLVQGAFALREPGVRWLTDRGLRLGVAASALVAALFLGTLDMIGVGAQGTMGLLFLWCGFALLRDRRRIPMWLVMGFLARGGFSLVEAFAYGAGMLPVGTIGAERASDLALFLGGHSLLDLAAEWLLALGGMLALARRGQDELQSTNDELLSAQDELRRLADRDPLTGLANRRALPESFRAVYGTGAAVVFFDLDGFKIINDTLGHAAGDACLVRFAEALRDSFRPSDAVVRYAGDEFVVVAEGMSEEMARGRLAELRERLHHGASRIDFSAGLALLAPGGDAAAALKTADQAMYEVKVAV